MIENYFDFFFVVYIVKKIYLFENVLFDVVSKMGLDGFVGNKSIIGELVGIEIYGGIK